MAKMTRAQFQFIANVLKNVRPADNATPENRLNWEGTVTEFAVALCSTNMQFDPQKFREACGQ